MSRPKHPTGKVGEVVRTVSARRQRPGSDPGEIQKLVGELRPDDGIDPRFETKRRGRAADGTECGLTHAVHQQERLMAQVQLVIDSSLQAAANPILNSLAVREVVKQGGSLLVVVTPRYPGDLPDLKALTQAINGAASMLSREVALAVTRKEAPRLAFMVLPAGAAKVDDSAPGGSGD